MAQGERIITKNLMEELVDMKLDAYIKISGMCDCEHCKADVRALSLNLLPPRYIASTGGGIFGRVQAMTNQSTASVIAAIMNAIRKVQSSPRHDSKVYGDKLEE